MDYQSLPYEDLKKLHIEIGQLIQTKKSQALEQLRANMQALGFRPEDLVVKVPKAVKTGAPKYRDPENSENVYGGKGPKPAWLKEALESGRDLEEFKVAA